MVKKFGYVSIESNSINSLSNNYQNIEKLRKELYGKPITEKSIMNALNKVEIRKYPSSSEKMGIFMFCPEDRLALIGRWIKCENDYHPSIRITWSDNEKTSISEQNAEIIKLLKEISKKLDNKGSN